MFFIHGRGIISNVEFNISSRTLAPFRTRQRNDQDHKSDSPNAHGLQIKQNIFVELNHRILSRYSSCVLRCSEVFEYNMKSLSFPQFLACCHRCWAGSGEVGPNYHGVNFFCSSRASVPGNTEAFYYFSKYLYCLI